MKCSNCGAVVTPDEVQGGACKFCGASLGGAPVGTVGAQVDQLLASLGVQPGTPAMTHIQDFLRVQQSFVVGGVTYRSLADIPPEARKALMLAVLAQRQAALQRGIGQLPEAAMGAAPVRARRRSGCGCLPVLFLLVLLGGLYAYWYFVGPPR